MAEKAECPKCGGAGWLWWDELDRYYGPAIKTGRDDTRYSCDHENHDLANAKKALADFDKNGGASLEDLRKELDI